MAFSTCFSRFLFLSAILLSPSVSSFSLLLLPLFFFPNVAYVLAVAPAHCAPARVARAMASDFHANLNVAAGVVSGTLTACGSTPLAVWGALPKRRGNAGSDSELSSHSNTFLEVRLDCVFASTLTLTLTLALALTHSHSAQFIRLSLRAHARAIPALSPLSRCLPFFSLLLVFVFVFSSPPLSYLLPLCTFFLLFFTSASSSWCFSSQSSSSHLFPPLLIHVGSSHFGFRLSFWEGEKLVVEQRTCPRTLHCVA